jgi:hypothetical protein
MKAGKASVDFSIGVEFASFDQLHHSGSRHEFGNGSGAEKRLLRRDSNITIIISL